MNDISKLNEAQLRDLNRLIVARLNSLRVEKQFEALCQFNEGDQVTWSGRQGRQVGTITKLNRTTATIQVKPGVVWRVSPSLLAAA
jgi:hypothetical protein